MLRRGKRIQNGTSTIHPNYDLPIPVTVRTRLTMHGMRVAPPTRITSSSCCPPEQFKHDYNSSTVQWVRLISSNLPGKSARAGSAYSLCNFRSSLFVFPFVLLRNFALALPARSVSLSFRMLSLSTAGLLTFI